MKEIGKVISALFDLSFRDLVTPRIIKPLYILAMIASLFFVTVQVANACLISDGRGIWAIFFSPFLLLFCILTVRVFFETLIAVFTVARNAQVSQETIGTKPTLKIDVDATEPDAEAAD